MWLTTRTTEWYKHNNRCAVMWWNAALQKTLGPDDIVVVTLVLCFPVCSVDSASVLYWSLILGGPGERMVQMRCVSSRPDPGLQPTSCPPLSLDGVSVSYWHHSKYQHITAFLKNPENQFYFIQKLNVFTQIEHIMKGRIWTWIKIDSLLRIKISKRAI